MNERRTFDLKVDRAETHLGELARLIDEYVDSHPYEIRRASDASGNKYTFYFHFTSQPSDDVAMALGDFVHNMRSALDYLACALVPPERREKMSFPIFFQGVWDASPSGETSRRREQRKRWRWCTERIDPHAVELLRRVQPPDNEGTVE